MRKIGNIRISIVLMIIILAVFGTIIMIMLDQLGFEQIIEPDVNIDTGIDTNSNNLDEMKATFTFLQDDCDGFYMRNDNDYYRYAAKHPSSERNILIPKDSSIREITLE